MASSIEPTLRGLRFPWTTRTRKRWVAERPPGSLAVTVIVTVPTRSPAMVILLPDTLNVALDVFEEVAPSVRSSPSGSPK